MVTLTKILLYWTSFSPSKKTRAITPLSSRGWASSGCRDDREERLSAFDLIKMFCILADKLDYKLRKTKTILYKNTLLGLTFDVKVNTQQTQSGKTLKSDSGGVEFLLYRYSIYTKIHSSTLLFLQFHRLGRLKSLIVRQVEWFSGYLNVKQLGCCCGDHINLHSIF